MADKNPSFAVKPGDPKDVSWGLTTAETCWKRDERSEALKWLRRAVEAASEAELDERALELAKVAADLATHIGSIAPPRPGPVAPAAPIAPRAAPAPTIASLQKPAFAKASAPVQAPTTARSAVVKELPRRAERKSVTNEATRARSPQATGAKPVPADLDAAPTTPLEVAPPPARKRTTSRSDRAETGKRASRTDEIDQWPTDVVAGHQLPPGLGAAAEAPAKPAGEIRASQAVRVRVWRDADGSIRVAAASGGQSGRAGAIEAVLAAVEPGTDLVALLAGA